MRFGLAQKRKFGTDCGAYSVVTKREFIDSQITLTDYEAEIALAHFGKDNIHVGNVHSNPTLSSKTFSLYPSGQKIKLNLVYPKVEKSELRLYLSSNAGFKPEGDEIWFMFVKDNDIWIGSMDESTWRFESSVLKRDEHDEDYQSLLQETSEIRISKLKERDTFRRDRRIALERMVLSGYKCEYDESHQLFISRFSKNQYLEAHHLVPISLQHEFDRPLDTKSNVYCLCPYCHRAVHHAEESLAIGILSRLASKRDVLDGYSLNIQSLLALYALEEIV